MQKKTLRYSACKEHSTVQEISIEAQIFSYLNLNKRLIMCVNNFTNDMIVQFEILMGLENC